MNTYTFSIDIDCPVCGKVVEDTLKKDSRVRSATLDFSRKKLTVTGDIDRDEIKRIAKDAEEDIAFLENDEEDTSGDKMKILAIRILISLILFTLSLISDQPLLALAAYFIAGYDVLIKAVKNIGKGRLFDENFLMGLATVGAIALSTYTEAAAVMIFYQAGEYLQSKASNRSRKSISSLMDLKAENARIEKNGKEINVRPETVGIGEIIIVKPGEKIPLDGIIEEGCTFLDMRSLTGEAVPVSVEKGDKVLSGSLNTSSLIRIKTTSLYENSTVSRIMDLMDKAKGNKSKSEQFITKFSTYYTPIVVFSAAALALIPSLITPEDWKIYVYRALLLLVVSCPCALVISIPLSYFAAMGSAAKRGILVKNSIAIQDMAHVQSVAFDKTGTLTNGIFAIREINTKMDKDKFLCIAASLENSSNHPIAKAITRANKLPLIPIGDATEIAGIGIKATIEEDEYIIGNKKILSLFSLDIEKEISGTVLYLASRREGLIGTITISDTIKSDAKETVARLKAHGVSKTIMITGDKKEKAEEVGKEIGIDEIQSGLLPDEKLKYFESLLGGKGITVYVGDGINDAPTIMRADVGIAMGGEGTDAAIEAADIVIMNDNISKIADVLVLSQKTERIVLENIVFALGIKAAVLALSAIGYSTMALAIFADVGVSLLATLNAMRLLMTKKRKV